MSNYVYFKFMCHSFLLLSLMHINDINLPLTLNYQFVKIILNQRAYKFIDENEYIDLIGPENRDIGEKRCN